MNAVERHGNSPNNKSISTCSTASGSNDHDGGSAPLVLNTSVLLTRYRCKLEECAQLHREVRVMHDKLHTSEQQLQIQKDAYEALTTEQIRLQSMLRRLTRDLCAAQERICELTSGATTLKSDTDNGARCDSQLVSRRESGTSCPSRPMSNGTVLDTAPSGSSVYNDDTIIKNNSTNYDTSHFSDVHIAVAAAAIDTQPNCTDETGTAVGILESIDKTTIPQYDSNNISEAAKAVSSSSAQDRQQRQSSSSTTPSMVCYQAARVSTPARAAVAQVAIPASAQVVKSAQRGLLRFPFLDATIDTTATTTTTTMPHSYKNRRAIIPTASWSSATAQGQLVTGKTKPKKKAEESDFGPWSSDRGSDSVHGMRNKHDTYTRILSACSQRDKNLRDLSDGSNDRRYMRTSRIDDKEWSEVDADDVEIIAHMQSLEE